jgi:transposase InsO family protein
MTRPTLRLCSETLFRLRIVTAVDALIAQGHGADAAVRLVAATSAALGPDGHRVSARTVQRWRRALRERGVEGLERAPRESLDASRALPEALVAFLRTERGQDPGASVPELIERARAYGVVGPETPVERTTVWRVMRRLGLDTARSRKSPQDARRFAYRERMQLVMADFKHFRVGPTRRRRLAVYLIDDATRFGLDVLVTTDGEDVETVLHAVERVLRKWGRFSVLYVDRGPGFRADDLEQVLSRLVIGVILGTAAYPEGRGKIERFNRSLKARLLRGLTAEGVDPDVDSLTLRLRHDLHEVYNHLPHESLDGDTPWQRWNGGRPLVPIAADVLARAFVAGLERAVSADHVVSVDGIAYEMPLGFARQSVVLERHLLDGGSLHHPDRHGNLVRLAPVDVHANAIAGRARRIDEAPADERPAVPTASMLRHAQQLGPITAPDGGFSHPDPDAPSDPCKED